MAERNAYKSKENNGPMEANRGGKIMTFDNANIEEKKLDKLLEILTVAQQERIEEPQTGEIPQGEVKTPPAETKAPQEWMENMEPWYQLTEKGKIKVNTGILARHLINEHPAVKTEAGFFLYIKGVYKLCKNEEAEGIVKNHINDMCCTSNLIADTANQWQKEMSIKRNINEFDNNPYILNVKNGLFNIKTGELKAHTPEHISAVQFNIKYNLKAKGEATEKYFEKFIPDNSDRLLAQEIAGYTLALFENPRHFFILKGKTNTGKSTFLNMIQNMISEENCSHITLQQLGDRFYTAELFGKVANIFADLPDKSIDDEGMIKLLTGNDVVQADRKFGQPFSFRNKAKAIFSCNRLPQSIGSRDEAFYNRLCIIPFEQQIKKLDIDPKAEKELKKEKDYFFLWALDGLKRLMKNNFNFTENKESERIKEEYKIKNNNVLYFINENCILGPEFYLIKSEFYQKYKIFCETNGHKPFGRNNFFEEIQGQFGDKIYEEMTGPKNSRQRALKGIAYADNPFIEKSKPEQQIFEITEPKMRWGD